MGEPGDIVKEVTKLHTLTTIVGAVIEWQTTIVG
jgi:hypothetical protein